MSEQQKNHYLAVPDSNTGPGVLVLHAWWGLNDFTRAFCDRLAGEGFVAYAPDLYHGQTAQTVEQAEQLASNLDQKRAAGDVLAALDALHGLDEMSGKDLGLIGFSMGAFWALWLAQKRPEVIRAVTLFYGTRPGDYSGSKADYLGHFAENDPFEPKSEVENLEKNLRDANCDTEFRIYEGVGHWFFEEDRQEAFNAPAARQAWQRTITFLHERLEG